jgi:hypothetical protein
MRPARQSAAVLVIASLAVFGCGDRGEELLPPTPRLALFQEPSACVPFPTPPLQPPDSAPVDPRQCLGSEWSNRGLPVEVSVVDGHVAEFRFYSQCSGETFTVAAPVRECIRKALASWRYPVWPTCPGQHSYEFGTLYLQGTGGHLRVASEIKHTCGG